MSSARPRALSTRPRRTVRSVIASIAAVALATGGILLASALPAEAHNSAASSTCQALTVSVNTFKAEDGAGGVNTITISVDGVVVPGYDHAEFGVQPGNGTVTVPFADPTKPHSWSVQLSAYDDPDGSQGWTRTITGASQACTAPTVAVSATTCTAVGGSTDLAATLTGLAAADAYRVELSSGGAVLSSRDFAAGTVPTPVPLGTHPAGATYTVVVTDLDIRSITATGSVTAASCPKIGAVTFAITPCSTVGGNAVLTITSSDGFVSGRSYQVHEDTATGPTVGAAFTADAATSYPVPVTPNGTEYRSFVLVDVATGTPVDASAQAVQILACPSSPTVISVIPSACTVGAPSSDVTISLAGLTADRTYVPSIDGVVKTDESVTASGSTATIVLSGVAPGSHTIVITDSASPTATARTTVQVQACATQPALQVTTTQCSVPVGGGTGADTGDLGVDLSNLDPTRAYTVSVTSGGAPVTGVADQKVTTATGTAHVDFTVPAAASYVVTVTDDQDARATATSSVITMDACPPQPQVGALSVSCTTNGSVATLSLGASDLVPGDRYTVLFERATASGYTAVKQVGPTASLSAADLSLAGVRVGQTYRVTLTDADNAALTDTLIVPVPDGCTTGQVGGVSYTAGGSVSALALTGTDTGRLALIALLLLIPGAGLIGFAALRHRREVGD